MLKARQCSKFVGPHAKCVIEAAQHPPTRLANAYAHRERREILTRFEKRVAANILEVCETKMTGMLNSGEFLGLAYEIQRSQSLARSHVGERRR